MARVGLERAGTALATEEVLAFQLAHAMARDAVHHPLDTAGLQVEFAEHSWPTLVLHSKAEDRTTYLRRPDLGRRLDEQSGQQLVAHRRKDCCDLAVTIVDGLSALAIHRHAVPFLRRLLPKFEDAGWSRAQLVLIEQGRVAIGDEIGGLLGSSLVLVLIGERPGLSSPDSLGVYMTWRPAPGCTDAERNCISNIRPEGLGYAEAAHRVFVLASEARRLQLTGIGLKENRLVSPYIQTSSE